MTPEERKNKISDLYDACCFSAKSIYFGNIKFMNVMRFILEETMTETQANVIDARIEKMTKKTVVK